MDSGVNSHRLDSTFFSGRGIRFSKPNFEMQRWRRIVRINFLLALACRKSNIPETVSGDRLRATIVMTDRSLRQIIFPFLLSLFFLPLLSLSLILSFFHPQPSNLKGPRSYRTIPRIVTLFPDVTSMLNRKVKRQFAVDGEEDRLIIIVL